MEAGCLFRWLCGRGSHGVGGRCGGLGTRGAHRIGIAAELTVCRRFLGSEIKGEFGEGVSLHGELARAGPPNRPGSLRVTLLGRCTCDTASGGSLVHSNGEEWSSRTFGTGEDERERIDTGELERSDMSSAELRMSSADSPKSCDDTFPSFIVGFEPFGSRLLEGVEGRRFNSSQRI